MNSFERLYFAPDERRVCFCCCFGQNPVPAQQRMRKAAHLLLYTDMTVKEIGSAVGYSNPNYFGKVFHRIYEMTPTEYREQKRD